MEGILLLSKNEVELFHLNDQQKAKFIKRIYGSAEFIRGLNRFVIWVEDEHLKEALSIPSLTKRINAVREMRLNSRDKSANDMARRSHQMREMNIGHSHTILVPAVSSEGRYWFQIGLIDKDTTITNRNFGLYDAPLWNFSILSSRFHLIWIDAVCGKLEMRFNYSNTIGWNTFPVPQLTEKNKSDLTACAEEILIARERHFPATIAELYNPENMPEDLRRAHDRNDEVLERIYIGRRFKNDTERLEKLFDLYTQMTSKGKAS